MPLKQGDKAKLHKWSGKIYNNFVSKAAKSRGMTFEEMRSVAKGRVWTGEDAMRHKLVDALGNLELAINMMKSHLEDESLGLIIYPRRKDSFEEFMKLLTNKQTISIEDFGFTLTDDIKNQLNYLHTLSKIAEKEKVCIALPHLINID